MRWPNIDDPNAPDKPGSAVPHAVRGGSGRAEPATTRRRSRARAEQRKKVDRVVRLLLCCWAGHRRAARGGGPPPGTVPADGGSRTAGAPEPTRADPVRARRRPGRHRPLPPLAARAAPAGARRPGRWDRGPAARGAAASRCWVKWTPRWWSVGPDLPPGDRVGGPDGAVGRPAPGRASMSTCRASSSPGRGRRSRAGTTTNTDLGPWVLQKIEGISKPALGQANFNFLFTHKVSKNIGPWPCWYASTFYAVGHASATVDLNPGPAWWAPASGPLPAAGAQPPAQGKPGHVTRHDGAAAAAAAAVGARRDDRQHPVAAGRHPAQLDLPGLRLRRAAAAAVPGVGAVRRRRSRSRSTRPRHARAGHPAR